MGHLGWGHRTEEPQPATWASWSRSGPRTLALPTLHRREPVRRSRHQDLGLLWGKAVEKRNVCGQMCRPRERGEWV